MVRRRGFGPRSPAFKADMISATSEANPSTMGKITQLILLTPLRKYVRRIHQYDLPHQSKFY